MIRRIALLIAIVAGCIAGAGATQASAAELFGQQVTPGVTIPSLQASGFISLKNVSVTTAADGAVTASAQLYAGTSTTPVAVTVSYRDQSNWSLQVNRGSAGAGYVPVSPTSLNINNIDGTITNSGGYLSYQLTLHGYVLGDATLDMTARIEADGFSASAVVEDLQLASFTLTHASIEVSSIDAYADIQTSLDTTGGNFDVDIKATKPGNATPNQYTLQMNFEGAELEGENPAFQFHSFGFQTTLTNPTTGCASINASAKASVTIGTNTYDLNDVTIGIACDKLTTFAFSVTLSHYVDADNVTKTRTLNVAFADPGSAVSGPAFSPPGSYSTKYQGEVDYWRGFFGSVDLSWKKKFSETMAGREMDAKVTIGLGFLVAVYQQVTYKLSTASYKPASWTAAVGAGGYVDADRISGDIECGASGGDFACKADLRVNPSWAGIYHYTWKGL